MKHTYYQVILKLKTPLSVGSGANETSDSDVITRINGKPYIPATAISGVMGHWVNEAERKNIFGFIDGEESRQSRIIFYDADIISDSFITVRNSVALKNKVSVPGAKFDFQIIEPGAEFVTYIELTKENEALQPFVEELVSAISGSALRFGRKTSRGYGVAEVISLKKAEFDMSVSEEKKAWLDFDVTDMNSWNDISPEKIKETNEQVDIIKISLVQNGALSIREYTTEENAPDYRHMSLHSDGTAVIPGTSWAGAFRQRFESLSGTELTEELFGYVRQKSSETRPSKIRFSESIISDNILKTISRTSIDRFSAGAKDKALYSEQTCYNGNTELVITIPSSADEITRTVLSAVILDLHNGFLAVGGLTSIGRGMFSIREITLNNESRLKYLNPDSVGVLLRKGDKV